MGMLSLPKERNKRLHAIIERSMIGAVATPFLAAGGLAVAGSGFEAGLSLGGGMALLFMAGMTSITSIVVDDPTPRISADLRGSPRRIADLLANASRNGMTPMDRLLAQRELDKTVEALTILCGKEPWIAAAQTSEKVGGLNDHLKIRADRLQGAEWMFSAVEKPMGCAKPHMLRMTRWFVPLLASVAADFGLDTTGLTPTTSRVSGQMLGEPAPISAMSQSLHRLASEWREGTNDLVDPLVRNGADAAAGRDLRALENAWAVARADSPPEFVDEVDERFAGAASALSATLSEAIALRGRGQNDVLRIEAAYVEAKHGSL